MPDLDFQVETAEPIPYAAAPLLAFKLRVARTGMDQAPIHSILLRCQIRIEPTQRRYGPQEQERLFDLFGKPEDWNRSLRSMLWTHTSVIVPTFIGSTVVDLPVPCTFDFNVAATKYFYALDKGEVPLLLLFSGTIFYEADDGRLQVAQVSWDKEAAYRLPVQTWQRMMDLYYPNSAWVCLRKDVFDRLCQYKSSRALPSWEQAFESLLSAMDEQVTA
jgi:hypothetical protein